MQMHTFGDDSTTAGRRGALTLRRETVIESRVLVRAVAASGSGHRADRKVSEKPEPSYFLLHPSLVLLGNLHSLTAAWHSKS